jgi:hypothetical protein
MMSQFDTPRDRPYEIMLYIGCILTGLSIFSNVRPQALSDNTPGWFLTYWYIATLLGGLIGFSTVFLRQRTARQLILTFRIEGGALTIIAAALFGLGVAAVAFGGRLTIGTLYILGWSIASVLRIWQVHIAMKQLTPTHRKE